MNRVSIRYGFGLNPNVKNSISLVEDHHLVYACGHQAVVVSIESKEQSFISGSVHPYISQGITAIASNTPKKIIAIAEAAEPVGAVALYDSQSLRRRKILLHSELGSREIVCVAFSNDGRLCVTQGGGPEWNLVLWNIERAVKVIGTVKISISDDTPVHQVSFCPWDANVIVVIGRGFVRLFRVTEGQLRPISVNVRRDSHTNFLSHAWMWEEKLLLGTEGGEIILLENLEFRAVIYPPSGETVEPMPILSLYPVAKGFIAGTLFGEMWIFEMSEDVKEQYQREEPISVPGNKGGVVSIVGSVDDSLVCATDTQQLYSFNMSSLGAAKESGSSGVDHLLTAFHGPSDLGDSTIVSIDTALWRPVIATCGKDYSIRVWNIQDRKIEIMKVFQEEPFSLAMHPSGLYLAVGFTDKIKLMSILLDDMTTTREFHIRSCSCMRFAAGGHLIACANGANVQIFSTYTGSMVTSLRHTAKVRAISWLTMDSKILTVSQEGSVYIWSVDKDKYHNASDSYVGVLPITTGISFSDGSKAFTVAADMIVKEIQLRKTVDSSTGAENAIRPPRDVNIDRHIACVALQETKKILFLGTSEPDKPGAILSIIASPHLATQFETTVLHATNITAMALSPDGDTLYSGDAFGCLLISDVESGGSVKAQQLAKARAAGAASEIIGPAQSGPNNGVAADFIEDVLIHKADLDAKRQKVNDLVAKVEELTLNNEHLLRVKEIEHKDTVTEIRNKFSAQLNSERFTYENVKAEKNMVEEDNATEIDQLQIQQESELTAVEDKYKAKLNAEAVRHRQLAAETEEVHKRWNEENRELVDAHQSHLQSLTAEYELKLSVEQNAQTSLRHEKEVIQHEHDIGQELVESDIDIEVTEMKAKYEARIKFEEEASVALTHEHTVMKRNLQMLNKDTEQQVEEIKRLKDKEDRLIETIHSLEKDIQSHKKEIREREETITDKEKRIFDLKKKNQELEKFRFVLDYKIKELKLQIAPREAEITTMRKQIEEMDLELEQYHKSNAALLLMISELKLKIEGLRRELVTQDDRIVVNSGLIDRFMKDLKEAHATRNDHALLKSKVVNLFRMYVQEDVGGKGDNGGTAGPEDPQLQYNRDREQMERSMDALRRSLHTDAALQKRDMSKMNRESVVLTRELNELRKDEQTLQMKFEAVDRVQRSANKTNILQLMTQYGLNAGKDSIPSKPQTNMPPVPPTQGRSGTVRRSTALRSASAGADGGLGTAGKSKSDLREAWRELEMQTNQIANLEDQLRSLCLSLNVDYLSELSVVEQMASGSARPNS